MSDVKGVMEGINYLPQPKWETGKRVVFLLALPGFDAEVNQIKFHDGVILRKARPWELTYQGKPSFLVSLYGTANSAEYLLELTLTARELRDTEVLASLWLGGAITALRLLKPNLVRVGQVYLYQPDVADSRRSEWWSYEDDHAELDSDNYMLTRKDTYTLRKIYKGMSELLAAKSFAPFRRFSSARSRIQARDRLIDYWIGLESLFSKEGESQELTYKYAIRIAHYVGKAQTSRFDLFSSMTKAYGARSKVVHGKKVKGLEEAEHAAERALRESLRKAVIEKRLPDQDDLDKRAASGEK
jgi:Apea-like HEPN